MVLPISYDALLNFFSEQGAYEQPSMNAKRQLGTELVTNSGMYLAMPPLRNQGYRTTPVNSLMFARTGGNGVHFSFIGADSLWSEKSPVVMTCPDAGSVRKNVILGESLAEFLRLGIRTGYFSLEQLGQAVDFSKHPFILEGVSSREMGPWLEPEQVAELESLAQRFALTQWKNVGERLEELQRRLLPGLELPAQAE
jgi:hypothetical protein